MFTDGAVAGAKHSPTASSYQPLELGLHPHLAAEKAKAQEGEQLAQRVTVVKRQPCLAPNSAHLPSPTPLSCLPANSGGFIRLPLLRTHLGTAAGHISHTAGELVTPLVESPALASRFYFCLGPQVPLSHLT